jgi:hypothetical protein
LQLFTAGDERIEMSSHFSVHNGRVGTTLRPEKIFATKAAVRPRCGWSFVDITV